MDTQLKVSGVEQTDSAVVLQKIRGKQKKRLAGQKGNAQAATQAQMEKMASPAATEKALPAMKPNPSHPAAAAAASHASSSTVLAPARASSATASSMVLTPSASAVKAQIEAAVEAPKRATTGAERRAAARAERQPEVDFQHRRESLEQAPPAVRARFEAINAMQLEARMAALEEAEGDQRLQEQIEAVKRDANLLNSQLPARIQGITTDLAAIQTAGYDKGVNEIHNRSKHNEHVGQLNKLLTKWWHDDGRTGSSIELRLVETIKQLEARIAKFEGAVLLDPISDKRLTQASIVSSIAAASYKETLKKHVDVLSGWRTDLSGLNALMKEIEKNVNTGIIQVRDLRAAIPPSVGFLATWVYPAPSSENERQVAFTDLITKAKKDDQKPSRAQ